MADESIRRDFVEGVQEIFTTMFNDGIEDGIDLYLLSTQVKKNVYKESKVKIYQNPVKLVAQAIINPEHGEQDVEIVKGNAQFVVPLKDLQSKEIDVSTEGLELLRKGVISFHGTLYNVDNVIPKAYVEDVFLLYTFVCTEDLQVKELAIEESLDEEGDENGLESDNDG